MNEANVAIVAGGTGEIGEGVVRAFLSNGYHVYVPERRSGNADRLKAYCADRGEQLVTVTADLGHADQVRAFADTVVERAGRVDAVVVSVGSYYYGHRLHRMPREDWDKSVSDNLITHFNLQQAFIRLLRDRKAGVYITLTGPESDGVRPESGVQSIMSAAQKMMTRVLAVESADTPVRVHAVTAHASILTRSRGGQSGPEWIPADALGEYICALASSALPNAGETIHDLMDRKHLGSLLKRRTR